MRVQVVHLDGIVSQYECQTIQDLKSQIANSTNTLETQINLIAGGEQLTSIQEGEMAYLTLELNGGKKKKGKKKAFTTKKKNKHKHRKEKLATLKLYSLDKNGAVQRLRKQCPQCPAGVYMAKHFDRHYCGTCHATFKMDEATIKANLEAIAKILKAKEAQKAAEGANQAVGGKDSKKDAKKGKKK